ncbi:MAG: N-acetylglucosamine transport system permease protein [Candidatus Latescibacterota bacterium]|jgi:N-acetylglucosamine transport system permease protein
MQRNWKAGLLFILPALLFYLLFMVVPYLLAFGVSFVKWRGVSLDMHFVGLANFATMFDDPNFWKALKNTVFFTVSTGIIVPVMALYFAVAVTRKLVVGAQFFRVTYFFPNLISQVAIAVLWWFALNPQFGILSNFLHLLGFENLPSWLGDPLWAPWCIVVVKVWAAVGFYMVLYVSSIQGIPEDYYDACKVDGAGEWQSFRHVTLPLLSEMMKVSTIFLLLNGFGTFDLVRIMTDGGPDRSTETLATYIYENAFELGKFGYATTIAMTLFFITFSLALLSLWLQRRQEVEY